MAFGRLSGRGERYEKGGEEMDKVITAFIEHPVNMCFMVAIIAWGIAYIFKSITR